MEVSGVPPKIEEPCEINHTAPGIDRGLTDFNAHKPHDQKGGHPRYPLHHLALAQEGMGLWQVRVLPLVEVGSEAQVRHFAELADHEQRYMP